MKKYLVLGAVALFAVMAVGNTANAEMGVGVSWVGDGTGTALVLPIKMASGMVLEPSLAFYSVSTDVEGDGDVPGDGTAFRVGLAVEKNMDAVGGATPFFGAKVLIDITSPDGDDADSFTDFGFGLFIGGSASIADNFDVVGYWGPEVWMIGERSEDGPTQTIIQSSAHLMVRWWLWGM